MHGWARKDGKIVLFAALSFAIGKGALAAVTAWYAQKGGVTFRANVSMWARLAMGMQESPIAAGWYNNYTEHFFSADVTAEQEKAQALADIGAQLCRMRENPAAALAFYREKLLTQCSNRLRHAVVGSAERKGRTLHRRDSRDLRRADDELTKAEIKKQFEQNDYLADPHTAVALSVYDDYVEKTGDNT